MKTLTLMLALVSLQMAQASIDTIHADSKISAVTVFFEGAQVSRTGILNLQPGKTLVIIDKLPVELLPNSIQLEEVENAKILAVKSEVSSTNTAHLNTHIERIEYEIDERRYELTSLMDQLDVLDMEMNILLKNSDLGTKPGGPGIEEIKAAAVYYRQRLGEIKTQRLKTSREVQKIEDKIKELYKQVNKIKSEGQQSYARILFSLETNSVIKSAFKISYYLGAAGWEATYDFRVNDITEPLAIVYNANVFQSTGEDWKNVELKLSTSRPGLSGITPLLNPWYLSTHPPVSRSTQPSGNAAIKGIVTDTETGEPIPFANIVVMRYGRMVGGGTSDFDGHYTIKPIPGGVYDLKATYVGYEPRVMKDIRIVDGRINFFDLQMKSGVFQLENIEVMDYRVPMISADKTSSGASFSGSDLPGYHGSGGTVTSYEIAKMPVRSANSAATTVGGVFSADGERGSVRDTRYIDGIAVRGSSALPQAALSEYNVRTGGTPARYNDAWSSRISDGSRGDWGKSNYESKDYISNSRNLMIANIEYEIDIPYTIISDGEDHNIKIKEVKVPVDYQYRAVPKLEETAFLNARIIDWRTLDLLSGMSSIYYEGTYVGEAYLDANQTNDTLYISLGRDQNIVINRKGNRELRKRSFVSNDIIETISWEIQLRNNKFSEININIMDQLPISQWRWVDVDIIDISGAYYNDKTGALRWKLKLSPGEVKKLALTYSVKYPRSMDLFIE